jgi:hypothetical protein
VLIYKKGDKTDCSNYSGISLVATAQNCIQNPAVKVSSMQRKSFRIINVDSDEIGQLLIIYFVFVKYMRRNGNTMRRFISLLWTKIKD